MKAIVVTHQGPCYVKADVFAKIAEKKKANHAFGNQILFTLTIQNPQEFEFRESGSLPHVASFEEFERDYLLKEPPRGRSIII